MTRIPDEGVVGRVEDPVKGNREFDDTEIGAQVSAGLSHFADEELSDVLSELFQLLQAEPVEVPRVVNCFQH